MGQLSFFCILETLGQLSLTVDLSDSLLICYLLENIHKQTMTLASVWINVQLFKVFFFFFFPNYSLYFCQLKKIKFSSKYTLNIISQKRHNIFKNKNFILTRQQINLLHNMVKHHIFYTLAFSQEK